MQASASGRRVPRPRFTHRRENRADAGAAGGGNVAPDAPDAPNAGAPPHHHSIDMDILLSEIGFREDVSVHQFLMSIYTLLLESMSKQAAGRVIARVTAFLNAHPTIPRTVKGLQGVVNEIVSKPRTIPFYMCECGAIIMKSAYASGDNCPKCGNDRQTFKKCSIADIHHFVQRLFDSPETMKEILYLTEMYEARRQRHTYEDIFSGAKFREAMNRRLSPYDLFYALFLDSFNPFVEHYASTGKQKHELSSLVLRFIVRPELAFEDMYTVMLLLVGSHHEFNELLALIVDYLRGASNEGVSVLDRSTSTRHQIRLHLLFSIADSPAAAKMLNLVGANGTCFCRFCKVVGHMLETLFPGTRLTLNNACPLRLEDEELDLRTIEDYEVAARVWIVLRTLYDEDTQPLLEWKQETGTCGPTLLMEIHGFNPATDMAIDMTHLIKGYAEKLYAQTLVSHVDSIGQALDSDYNPQGAIRARLVEFKKYLPRDFGSNCSDILKCSHWKVESWHNWLLYLGVPAMKGLVSNELLSLWNLLVLALTLVYTPICTEEMLVEADLLLRRHMHRCVRLFLACSLYCSFYHMWLHLADNIRHIGHARVLSVFRFEQLFHKIKPLHQGGNHAGTALQSRIMIKQHIAHIKAVRPDMDLMDSQPSTEQYEVYASRAGRWQVALYNGVDTPPGILADVLPDVPGAALYSHAFLEALPDGYQKLGSTANGEELVHRKEAQIAFIVPGADGARIERYGTVLSYVAYDGDGGEIVCAAFVRPFITIVPVPGNPLSEAEPIPVVDGYEEGRIELVPLDNFCMRVAIIPDLSLPLPHNRQFVLRYHHRRSFEVDEV